MRVTLEVIDGAGQANYAIDGEGWEHYAYTLRLHYDGRTMDTPWRQGVGIMEDPNARDVLESMLATASGIDCARDFEDWAADYGFDTDSRKAEQTYRACVAESRKLRALLGDAYDVAMRADDSEVAAAMLAGAA